MALITCPNGELTSDGLTIKCKVNNDLTCSYQKYCNVTRDWENTPEVKKCPLRQKTENDN